MAVCALVAIGLIAGCGCSRFEKRSLLAEYEGTYRGIGLEFASGLGGEAEAVIDAQRVAVRMPAGAEIFSVSIPVAEVKPMTPEELAVSVNNETYRARTTGFRTANGYEFLFLRDPMDESEFGLTIISDRGLWLAALHNPAQVARGDFEKLLTQLEKDGPSIVPRLPQAGP